MTEEDKKKLIKSCKLVKEVFPNMCGNIQYNLTRDRRKVNMNISYSLIIDPEEYHNLWAVGMNDEQQIAFDQLTARLLQRENREGPYPVGYTLPVLDPAPDWGIKRNGQFPSWPPNLTDAEEISAMNNVEDEIREAGAQEPDVVLADLDLDRWVKNGGSAAFAAAVQQETAE